MKYKETGFRAFYHNFNAFMMTDALRNTVADFPDSDKANCVLTYGYIDHEEGLTLEVLAAGLKTDTGFRFFNTNDAVRSFIRIEAAEDAEFYWFEDNDGKLAKRFASKLDALKGYAVDDDIEKTRSMGFLDACRDDYCIDDVMVYLTRDGLEPEGCWVRIMGLGDHCIIGSLLNEPNQNFGYHLGETVAFFVRQDDDKNVTCFAEMNPSRKLTAEDLEDGSMLKEAIRVFNADRTQQNIIEVMELLRDSTVWVPCTAVFSERDQEIMQKAIESSDGDLDSLIGKEFVTQDELRLIPDILQNGDLFFFPAFSSEDEMGEYGEAFSKIPHKFVDIIPLAINNEKNVAGIVINAFTDPFVLDKELFDLVAGMKSRIE